MHKRTTEISRRNQPRLGNSQRIHCHAIDETLVHQWCIETRVKFSMDATWAMTVRAIRIEPRTHAIGVTGTGVAHVYGFG